MYDDDDDMEFFDAVQDSGQLPSFPTPPTDDFQDARMPNPVEWAWRTGEIPLDVDPRHQALKRAREIGQDMERRVQAAIQARISRIPKQTYDAAEKWASDKTPTFLKDFWRRSSETVARIAKAGREMDQRTTFALAVMVVLAAAGGAAAHRASKQSKKRRRRRIKPPPSSSSSSSSKSKSKSKRRLRRWVPRRRR